MTDEQRDAKKRILKKIVAISLSALSRCNEFDVSYRGDHELTKAYVLLNTLDCAERILERMETEKEEPNDFKG